MSKKGNLVKVNASALQVLLLQRLDLLRLKAIRDHYSASFDSNYAMGKSDELASKLPSDRIFSEEDARVWLVCLPALKQIMEQFWQRRPNQEPEAQQRMVVEDNFGPNCRSTDYCICDIEYAVPKEYQFHKRCRFDMVGVHWPATDSHQANQNIRDWSCLNSNTAQAHSRETAACKNTRRI